ncbi:MAG TPA: hypothetical protein ENH62_13195 [Marinobacter sp.]|jgi:predicted GIY-YIG superfamily endonuclease|uniref:GIY-YIG domain-containing protein n=2 Tax=root TaxID=1 RepID=A0A0F9RNA4_9ZZZZ|nr:hypothetical protein [Marinobacter sp.]
MKEYLMPIKLAPGVRDNNYFVYVLENPFNNTIFYIGYTGNLKDRFRSHVRKTPSSIEGKARATLIMSIHRAGEEITMTAVKSYSYRGLAMKFESTMIYEAYDRNEPLLNAPSKHLQSNLEWHLNSIPS